MKKSRQKGITLIALVITIIVLLILAGVTIATLMGNNGLLTRAQEAKQRTEVSENEEEGMLNDLNNMMENYTQTTEGFDGEVNSPKLSSGMIPVYYDETNKVWKKADKENKDNSWYKYGTVEKENKKWANIVTVKEEVRNEYMESEVGTEIKMEDITTMFVWIPRYSYEIEYDKPGNKNAGGRIHVSFLQGNTNKEESGEETEKIVHPGFEMNGVQLKGIWIAKFEASGLNDKGEYLGNRTSTNSQVAETTGAYVTVKPSVPSWREINIGESQYQSMKISTDKEHYGLTSANSHLIKNVEWGAVAYLCYSEYGEIPQINACGSYNGTYYYDLYTGAGPQADGNETQYSYDASTFESNYAYNTANGKLASTTGNETGIYDMSGGSWERVAIYLDNKNDNLLSQGNSSSNSSIKYFNDNKEINPQYSAYWEKYEVSEEERSGEIDVGNGQKVSHTTLWNGDQTYNEARQRLTNATFNLLEKHKGIGVNEVSENCSYYGKNSSNAWTWLPSYVRTWDNDVVLIGHACYPFVMRGGYYNYTSSAGVLCSSITNGGAGTGNSFRPALAF